MRWSLRWALSLQRRLHEAKAAHQAALGAVARKELQIEVLSRELEQTRRDAELLALMSRDRRVALEFIRDAHAIEHLDESA